MTDQHESELRRVERFLTGREAALPHIRNLHLPHHHPKESQPVTEQAVNQPTSDTVDVNPNDMSPTERAEFDAWRAAQRGDAGSHQPSTAQPIAGTTGLAATGNANFAATPVEQSHTVTSAAADSPAPSVLGVQPEASDAMHAVQDEAASAMPKCPTCGRTDGIRMKANEDGSVYQECLYDGTIQDVAKA